MNFQILTSVFKASLLRATTTTLTTATLTPIVPTPRARSSARVIRDTREMGSAVQVNTNTIKEYLTDLKLLSMKVFDNPFLYYNRLQTDKSDGSALTKRTSSVKRMGRWFVLRISISYSIDNVVYLDLLVTASLDKSTSE